MIDQSAIHSYEGSKQEPMTASDSAASKRPSVRPASYREKYVTHSTEYPGVEGAADALAAAAAAT
eukprot:1481396-Prymnesium_polylepis.1